MPAGRLSVIPTTARPSALRSDHVGRSRRRSDNDETELLIGERPHGTFSRQLFLSDTLDTERLEAQYTDGVLAVRIPIKEQAKPRRVSVAGGRSERTSIDAKTSDRDSDPVGAATS